MINLVISFLLFKLINILFILVNYDLMNFWACNLTYNLACFISYNFYFSKGLWQGGHWMPMS